MKLGQGAPEFDRAEAKTGLPSIAQYMWQTQECMELHSGTAAKVGGGRHADANGKSTLPPAGTKPDPQDEPAVMTPLFDGFPVPQSSLDSGAKLADLWASPG